MKHLGISGGGTRITHQLGALLEIEKSYKPDIISGVSAGAILSLLYVTDKLKQAEKLLVPFKLSDFMSKKGINEKGKLTIYGLKSIIMDFTFWDRWWIGLQSNLKVNLKNLISEKDWEDYQNNSKVKCYIAVVDISTGEKKG